MNKNWIWTLLRTDFDPKPLHPRDEDVRREEPPHRLAAVDGELAAVEVLVDVGRAPIVAGQRPGVSVAAGAVVAVHLLRRRDRAVELLWLLQQACFSVFVSVSLSNRSLSMKHIAQ